MFLKGDFHMHSSASDGKHSPEELVKHAKANGLDIIAVTDHDTTASDADAVIEGEKIGVKVIPGIELSTLHNGESIHIIGLFKDNKYLSEAFQSKLEEMQNFRQWRGKKIVENLHNFFNIDVDYDKVSQSADGIIARPHIAKAIIAAGYDYSWDYIFKNIINNDSPAYVANKKLTIEEGIAFLKSANAVTIMAHPVLIKKSDAEDLIKFDFDGIEAVYPLNSEADTVRFKSLAAKYNKFVSSGSDFHGLGELDTSHGEIGSVYLKSEEINIILEKLKAVSH